MFIICQTSSFSAPQVTCTEQSKSFPRNDRLKDFLADYAPDHHFTTFIIIATVYTFKTIERLKQSDTDTDSSKVKTKEIDQNSDDSDDVSAQNN